MIALASGLLAAACSSDAPFPEDEGIRQLRAEFPSLNQLTDEELAAGGRALCAELENGLSPSEIVSEGIGPATDEDSRKAWGLVFFAVRVYCPEFEDDLPTEKPY